MNICGDTCLLIRDGILLFNIVVFVSYIMGMCFLWLGGKK
jgi:hypothetical protein